MNEIGGPNFPSGAYPKDALRTPLVPAAKTAIVENILTGFIPQSGAEFVVQHGAFHIFPPGRFAKENFDRLSGYDMTRRTLSELERDIPGLNELISDLAENPGVYARDEGAGGNKHKIASDERNKNVGFSTSDVNLRKKTPRLSAGKFIEHERGKVLVLGNGLSNLPIDLSSRFSAGQLSEPPVVVDLVDYELLLGDLRGLSARFREAHEQYPFSDDIVTLEQIVAAKQAGNLRTEVYMVGSGNPPESLQKTSLIISTGPSLDTLSEQTSFLKPGGTLVLSEFVPRALSRLPQDIARIDQGRGSGAIFRKTA